MKETADFHALANTWYNVHGSKLRNKSLKADIKALCSLIPEGTPLNRVYFEVLAGVHKAEYAEWTRSKILSLLRRIARWSEEWGLVPKGTISVGPVKRPKDKTRFLSLAEETQLLKAHKGMLPLLLLDTGARIGEALAVTPEAFRFDKETEAVILTLRRTKVYRETMIPLSKRLLARYNEEKGRWTPGKPIFEMIEVRKLRTDINTICNCDQFTVEEKGRATIHSLRHTFATRALERGVDISALSYIMVHASIKETLVYTNIVENQEIAKRAVRMLW